MTAPLLTEAQIVELRALLSEYEADDAKVETADAPLAAALAAQETHTRLANAAIAALPELLAESERADAAERELQAVSDAIGSTRFMDPPDGGSVSLAEQVRRMREALTAAEAAYERLRAALRAALERIADDANRNCDKTAALARISAHARAALTEPAAPAQAGDDTGE